MLPLPHLPRWQQYLLLAGAVVAALAFACLRWEGHPIGSSLLPLVLPFMLWWPQPTTREQRIYWWLMVGVFFSVNLSLVGRYYPLS